MAEGVVEQVEAVVEQGGPEIEVTTYSASIQLDLTA